MPLLPGSSRAPSLNPGLPSGTPYLVGNEDHLGDARCNPCVTLPDGHPVIGLRLTERAAVLGYASVAEMRSKHAFGGTYPPVRSAEEVAEGMSPNQVAKMYGYPDAAEMRRCEVAGRETDEELDARAREVGLASTLVLLDREAKLAVLDVAERFAASHECGRFCGPLLTIDPMLGHLVTEGARRAAEPRCPLWAERVESGELEPEPGRDALGPVSKEREEVPVSLDPEAREAVRKAAERLAALRAPSEPVDPDQHGRRQAMDHHQEQLQKLGFGPGPFTSKWYASGGGVFVGPVDGGELKEVGTVSSDGVSVGRSAEVRHELVKASQWRGALDVGFAGSAECACGVVYERAAADGGPKAARAAIEMHVAEWSENRLTADLRARLKEMDRAWSELSAQLDEERERRLALEERQDQVRQGLRQQLGTLGALVAERTGERDRFRRQAARLNTAVSAAWTELGGLAGTDADLIHEQVARVRERLAEHQRKADEDWTPAAPGGGSGEGFVGPGGRWKVTNVGEGEPAAEPEAPAAAGVPESVQRAYESLLSASQVRWHSTASPAAPVGAPVEVEGLASDVLEGLLRGLQGAVSEACGRLATVPVDSVAATRQMLAEALRASREAGAGE